MTGVSVVALALALVLVPYLHRSAQAANLPMLGSAVVLNSKSSFISFDEASSSANVRADFVHHRFSGYAWSDDLGWLDFGDFDNPAGPVTFDKDTGLLSGKAYALATGGYLHFSDENSSVSLDLNTGELSGYAFSDDIGWVSFDDGDVKVDGTFPIDNTEPSVNASNLSMQTALSGGYPVPDGEWSSSFTPYFSWDDGQDNTGGVGLKGYCLYLGTEASADPGNHLSESGTSGLLINSPLETAGTSCRYITAGTSLDLAEGDHLASSFVSGETYYLHIKAIDKNNNTYNEDLNDSSAAATFSFKFDSTPPTNVSYINVAPGVFNNIGDINFSWPVSDGSGSSDAGGSGVLGWQYSLNGTENWQGSESHDRFGIEYIPFGFTQPFHLSAGKDDLEVGTNTLYFRTVDKAGNYSSAITNRAGGIEYGGDAPTFAEHSVVTVSPATSTSNNFGLSWPSATAVSGNSVDKYYYMINTSPPETLATLRSNPATYLATTNTSVPQGLLAGAQKGSNTVTVVAVDTGGNYSKSNKISGSFTLDSSNPDPAKNLSVSDASVKSASLWRASLAWDHPDYRGTGSLTYIIERSNNGTDWQEVTTTNGTAFVDLLPESKGYFWRIGTRDTTAESQAAPSFTNAVTLTPKGTYTDPAELTSGPEVDQLTTRKARIKWTTNRKSDSKVAFGLGSKYFDEEPSNSNQVTEHLINLTNLLPGENYKYQAKWTDEDGNTGTSSQKSFTTMPAPSVTDPQATQVGLSSAIIRFRVAGASKVRLYYGKTTTFGAVEEIATSVEETVMTTQLSGLEDGSLYYYKINPVDSEGFEYQGQALTFETMPRPKISNVTLQEVAGSAQTTILVSWVVNTPVSSIISYSPIGNSAGAKTQTEVDLLTGPRQMTVSGLLPNEQYQLTVRGRDKAGNEAVSDVFTFTTATDTRPPQIMNLKVVGGTVPPVGFAAGDVKAQLVISWDTDEPATSQVEFGEGAGSTFSQKTQEDGNMTTNHTVIVSSLTPSRVYHFRVISKDAGGNESRSIDQTTIAPKATRSAFDLVIESLSSVFGFVGIFNNK